ncbi:tRNA (N6-isopentenyl adenosine(37)-C2)-methylthiotransferase MiaB [Candidatus Marinimicrobia bacterium MT.SAG.3]|nr:tRNA (N6-isopentenyl adenosine(37)-C2)-methylthiotransferase MiaB [Candidatus Marinimicrobia bacterium MT.SAG.3]
MKQLYHIETYGCQMNVYDSELVARILDNKDISPTDSAEAADYIFINTCSVRDKAELKVLNRLKHLEALKKKNTSLVIGVIGCMAQNLKEEILENKPFVNFVLGPDSYGKLSALLDAEKPWEVKEVHTDLSKYETYDYIYPLRNGGNSAMIAIMRGCDKMCTFCIVPFTRGRERSKSAESVVNEVKQAVVEGFREVTLLGQNVNSYDDGDLKFPDLMERVAQIEGVKRIRFTSPHPQDASDELIEVMLKYDNICNHIHLPLQSGSDSMLERMNRNYTKEEFISLAEKFRKRIPGIAISTDIIVGFCGETEEEFSDTLDVVRRVKFDSAFMFKYSERPHTAAFKRMPDDVPEELKGERLTRLIELQKINALEINKKLVGKTLEVQIEKISKKSDDHYIGRTDTNKLVVIPKNGKVPGDFLKALITEAAGITLFGEPVSP